MQWSDIPRNPSRPTLRQFAALWLVILGGLGIGRLLASGSDALGTWLLVVAVGGGVPGLACPRALRRLDDGRLSAGLAGVAPAVGGHLLWAHHRTGLTP